MGKTTMRCIKLAVQLHCPAVGIKSRCQKQSSNRGTGGPFVSGDKSGTLSRKRANTEGAHAACKSTGTCVGGTGISYLIEFRSRLIWGKSRHECCKFPPNIIRSKLNSILHLRALTPTMWPIFVLKTQLN